MVEDLYWNGGSLILNVKNRFSLILRGACIFLTHSDERNERPDKHMEFCVYQSGD